MRPVKKIEVNMGNTKLRAILAGVFLVIAMVSIGYGVSLLVNKSEGWREVEVTSKEPNCSTELVFNYLFGESGVSVNQEYRAVAQLYTQSCQEGYDLFQREGELAKLKPNTPVKVDKALYDALYLVHESGNRSLYLANVYDEYQRMFLCENEDEAARYDPAQDPELAELVAEMAAYANDPDMIGLEFAGGKVTLRVADAYLSYAEEMGITQFLDLGWMRNAFIVDYIADRMVDAGYTHGYLASFDGFTRNLDASGTDYDLNLFGREGTNVVKPGTVSYSSPASLVQLRDFPMSQQDRWHYYAFPDGHIASVYTDPADGMTKCAVPQLVAYGQEKRCAEILMEVAPVFLQDALQEDALGALTEKGIYSLWCVDGEIRYNQQGLQFSQLTEGYKASYVNP